MLEVHLIFVIIGIILAASLSFFKIVKPRSKEGLSFYHCKDFEPNSQLLEIFKNQKIERSSDITKADIYLACGYNDVENEYDRIPIDRNKYIHAIRGCDQIVAKNFLWKWVSEYYGKAKASEYLPYTYLLDVPEDKLKLLQEDPEKIFILKKNIQRQEGLKLVRKKELTIPELNKLSSEQYVIAQEYLDNPFLVNKRKINLRVYLLIVIKNGVKYAYIHRNGFMYYTKNEYKYSTVPDDGITTGYIDRKVYSENPLSHADFRNYLIQKGYNPEVLFGGIANVTSKVLDAVHHVFKFTNGKVNYQLFGMDIQPDVNLKPILLESNKGSDLSVKDIKDGAIKMKVQEDIYRTIGIISDEKGVNEFDLVWQH